MKFVKTADGEILNTAYIRSAYVILGEDEYEVIAYSKIPLTGMDTDDHDYTLGIFENKADADKFLDDLLKKLNGDD